MAANLWPKVMYSIGGHESNPRLYIYLRSKQKKRFFQQKKRNIAKMFMVRSLTIASKVFLRRTKILGISVADPECLSRIWIFPDSRIWVFPSQIPDPEHWIYKEFKYPYRSKLSEIWSEKFIRMPDLWSRIRIFSIPDPEPESWGKRALDPGSGSATLLQTQKFQLFNIFYICF